MDTNFAVFTDTRDNLIIENDGFYPDMSLEGLTDRFAIDGDLKQSLLVSFIKLAMSRCNEALKTNKKQWLQKGLTELKEVNPTNTLGNQTESEMLYTNAVYFAAYAEICSTQDRSQRNLVEAAERLDRAAIYQQKSTYALGQLSGHGKIQVRLL